MSKLKIKIFDELESKVVESEADLNPQTGLIDNIKYSNYDISSGAPCTRDDYYDTSAILTFEANGEKKEIEFVLKASNSGYVAPKSELQEIQEKIAKLSKATKLKNK